MSLKDHVQTLLFSLIMVLALFLLSFNVIKSFHSYFQSHDTKVVFSEDGTKVLKIWDEGHWFYVVQGGGSAEDQK